MLLVFVEWTVILYDIEVFVGLVNDGNKYGIKFP